MGLLACLKYRKIKKLPKIKITNISSSASALTTKQIYSSFSLFLPPHTKRKDKPSSFLLPYVLRKEIPSSS